MSIKILLVDDEVNVLEGLQRTLRKKFTIETAIGGEKGLEALQAHGPYAVVMSDMQMPGMNGAEFLSKVGEQSPDTVRLMLTGNADQKTAVDAVNVGRIFQFLNKPVDPDTLINALQNALRQHQLITAEKELLEKTLAGSVKMLTDILASLDPQAFGQGQRIKEQAVAVAKMAGVTQTWDIELAALLSDVGLVTIPAEVLAKMRRGVTLTGPERDMVARCPEIGSRLLGHIPRLEPVAKIVQFHGKNFDGTGFPVDGVSGEAIPIGSRILRILRELAQLEGKGIVRFKALERMRETPGHFDPAILAATRKAFDLAGQGSIDDSVAITLKDLQVGHVLRDAVRTLDDMLILTKGSVITPLILERVRNFADLSGVKEPILVAKELDLPKA